MLDPSRREQVLGEGGGAGLARGFWHKGVRWHLSPSQSYVKNNQKKPSGLHFLSYPFLLLYGGQSSLKSGLVAQPSAGNSC